MPDQSDSCRLQAVHCLEVAETTRSSEDQCEFLELAESWTRLAAEIDQNERLVALINELTTITMSNVEPETDELEQHALSARHSFKSLAISILDHVVTLASETKESAHSGPETEGQTTAA